MPIETIAEARTFVLVVEGGSLSAAARTLHVSPNAISQRVRAIEARAGTRLLNRTTRSMSLTEEGAALYRRCLRIVDEVEAAEAEVAPTPAQISGRVRLASPTALAGPELLTALNELAVNHPKLRVQLIVTDERPVDLIGRAIDIAVHYGQPADSSLILRHIGVFKAGLCASPAYLDRKGRPESPADLVNHDCLRFVSERPQDEWGLVDADGREIRVRVGGWFECDTSRVLGDAVYAGLGIGVRPDGEIARAEAHGQLERVLPMLGFGAAPIVALMAPGRHRLARVRRVLEVVTGVTTQILRSAPLSP